MASLVDKVVAHGLGARYEDMPGPARAAAATFLLDTLGVGIAGAAHPLTDKVRRAALSWGGLGPGRLWGPGELTATSATAAFINGFQIHCQEFDCVHEPAVVHPMATILSAVMATIDALDRKVTGPELSIALAVGVDLAAGLGVAARSPLKFFRPANAGLFGAVLAISRLRGFGEDQTKDALGYALAFNAGTMQAHVEGKPTLPLQIANAARNAIAAADLAGLGIAGPHDSLEGPFGYFRLFEDRVDASLLSSALGQVWRISEISHKPFPTGRACQGGIELMAQLAGRIGSLDTVSRVTLSAPPLIHRLVGRPWQAGMTPAYARLCFAYCGAVALRSGTVGLDDFTPERIADPVTAALAGKFAIEIDSSDDAAAFTPQTARIDLANGEALHARIDALPGSPAKALTPAQNEAKFRSCAAFGFAAASDRVADALIWHAKALDTLDDTAILTLLASGQELAA